MIICKACGAENPLGHVFCSTCSAKLDLSNLSSAAVGAMQKESWVRRYRLFIAAGIVLSIAIPTVLALWPRTTLIGEPGRPVGVNRVQENLQTLHRHAANPQVRGFEIPFSEQDINGYFAYGRSRSMKLESVSLRIGDGAFQVRVVRPLASVNLRFVEWVPRLSYDMTLAPYGPVLRPLRVSMGRLRLSGPFRRSVLRGMRARFASQREWTQLSAIVSDIRAEPGQLVIAAAKP